MNRIIQYLVKASLFTLRYFVCPLVIIFGIIFFILTFPVIGSNSINYYPLILLSLIFGSLFSSPIFMIQIATKITFLLAKRIDKNANRITTWTQRIPKPSIKTRLELRKYFSLLAISMFLISSAFFSRSIAIQIASEKYQPPPDFFVGYISLVAAFFFIQIYLNIYKQDEKALFFLEQSVTNIDYCLKEGKLRPSSRLFEIALKSYQKILPSSYPIKNLEKKLKQIELLLKRGTKEEIIKFREFVNALANSIKQHDSPSFDRSFSELSQFLEQFEHEKETMYELNKLSRREAWKKTLSEFLKPSLEKVIGYLILLAILVLLYYLVGVNLAGLLGWG